VSGDTDDLPAGRGQRFGRGPTDSLRCASDDDNAIAKIEALRSGGRRLGHASRDRENTFWHHTISVSYLFIMPLSNGELSDLLFLSKIGRRRI